MGAGAVGLMAGGIAVSALVFAAPANAVDASDSATVDVTCDLTVPGLGLVTYQDWPTTLTVSPAAAAPGATATVSVSVNGSPVNGPVVALAAGAYRMEAAVQIDGVTTQLIGPTNASSVAVNAPMFAAAQLPTVATGTVTLPSTPGDHPVTVNDLYYNSITGTGTSGSLNDTFDYRCNSSALPRLTPTPFAEPTVTVTVGEETEVPAGAVGGLGIAALAAVGLGAVLLRPRRRRSSAT